ncbi:MAG: YggS family pyridoxal phosphate-dependent enzyme [Defluviitaleaceae bacterium]|nr:YggS family pyridoxal phosphate-dependent enzyme [Defluviitaleaceae bacterium]
MIEKNIKQIKTNILRACEISRKNPDSIKIVAVTKTIEHARLNDCLKYLLENGITDIGENRVQEMMEKQPYITENINWHMIGNLQRNKAKYIVGKVKMIQSLDSIKLATEINRVATRDGTDVDVLIEVNIAGEESKHGITPEQVLDFAKETTAFSNIHIKGLMTVAPYVKNPEENRINFRKMRELYETLKNQPDIGNKIEYLSMGMTNDYPVAVEEGANIVRIGTGIFGNR